MCLAASGSSRVFPAGLFLLLGLLAVVFGVGLAFDVRSMATRKAKGVRERNSLLRAGVGGAAGPGSMWGRAGYYRFLGGVALLAGTVLLVAGSALSGLG